MTVSRLVRIVRQRLRSLLDPRGQDRALDAELAFHLEQAMAEKIADGAAPDEARRAALREFGNVTLVVEESREARRLAWLHDLTQDGRYGWRMLRRAPGFSLVAIASLAIGIGASTAVIGAMRAILWQPLPFPDADRLVAVRTIAPDGTGREQGASLGEYVAWQERNRTLDAIALSLSSPREISAESGGRFGERLASQAFTPNLFGLLGVRPALGRLLEDADSPFSPAARVMLISHRLWQRRYGGAPDIVGRVVPTDGSTRTIVGVLPADFHFQDDNVDFWIPLIPGSSERQAASIGRPFGVTARLRRGVTPAEAEADLAAISADLVRDLPERFRGRGVRVELLHDAMYGWTKPLLYTLLGAVAMMLTIACANVAGLLLARATTRQRELWVRLSLGAGRGRIVRQLLTESLLTSVSAGLIGIGVALVSLRLLVAAMGPPPGKPRIAMLPFEPLSAVVAIGLSIAAALAVGLVPALVAVRRRSPGTAPPAGGDLRATRTRGGLVAVQLAMAMVLLAGAGLLVNSFLRLANRTLNFEPDNLASFQFVVEGQDFARRVGFDGVLPVFELSPLPADAIARVHERLRAVPGIDAVGGMTYQPVNSFIIPRFPAWPAGSAGGSGMPAREPNVSGFLVTPGFFAAMRTPILEGREVSETDTRTAPGVVVINQSAARHFFPGRSAVGQRLVVELARGAPAREVIGIVADVPPRRKVLDPEPVIYLPSRQMPAIFRGGGANFFGIMTFVVRHSGDEAAMVDAARRAVAEVEPARPLVEVGVVRRALDARLPELSTYVSAVVGFGIVAMLLAAIGVYGVTAYAVSMRTRELGIRRALGAGARQVVTATAARTASLITVGLTAGLLTAAVLTPLIESQLVGVAPTDPMTFAAAAALLAVVAGAACVGPTRRALSVDPASVLRSE